MHELSLMADLLRKVEQLAKDAEADKVTAVRVKLGALSHITPDHFREHFEEAAIGTVAEGATLDVEQSEDRHDPNAQDILLESVDVAA
jgi:hydrogenase nickel incorporation protein HypA/HybF